MESTTSRASDGKRSRLARLDIGDYVRNDIDNEGTAASDVAEQAFRVIATQQFGKLTYPEMAKMPVPRMERAARMEHLTSSITLFGGPI